MRWFFLMIVIARPSFSHSQNIIELYGLKPVLPSSDKVLTAEMAVIEGTNYFTTTGDNNTKLWDINSRKMLARLSNPNAKAATPAYNTFFHPKYNQLIQSTVNSINVFSFPELELVHNVELNEFIEPQFHAHWDFFLNKTTNGFEAISLSTFEKIKEISFPFKLDDFGIIADSSSVYYYSESGKLGFADIESPMDIRWVELPISTSEKVVEFLTPQLIIIEKEINRQKSPEQRNMIEKEFYFCDLELRQYELIPELESSPENVVFSKKWNMLVMNDSYYKSKGNCMVYSLNTLKLIKSISVNEGQQEIEPESSTSKNVKFKKIVSVFEDVKDGLIWILFDSELVAYSPGNWSQSTKIVGKFDSAIRVGDGLAILDKESKMFIISDYKKSLHLHPVTTDFIAHIYKVESTVDNQLRVLTQSGAHLLDLEELKLGAEIPFSKSIRLSNLDRINFWKGNVLSLNRGKRCYYIHNDSIRKEPFEIVYTELGSDIVYLASYSAILRLNVLDSLEEAKEIVNLSDLPNGLNDFQEKSNHIDHQEHYDYSVFQFNPSFDSFFVLGMAINSDSVFFGNYGYRDFSKRYKLFKVNRASMEMSHYKLPRNCSNVISLQNGYFLVQYENILHFNSKSRFSGMFKLKRRDRILVDNGRRLKTFYKFSKDDNGDLEPLIGDSDGRVDYKPFLLLSDKEKVWLLRLPSGKRELLYTYTKEEKSDKFEHYIYNAGLNRLYLYSFRGNNLHVDLSSGEKLIKFKAHPWQQNSIGYFEKGGVFTADNEEIKLWTNGKCISNINFHINNGFYIRDSTNLYYATKNIIKELNFVDRKLNPVGFEQIDPFCNRPEKIQMSMANFLEIEVPESNKMRQMAWFNRVKKLGLNDVEFNLSNFSFPSVSESFSNGLSYQLSRDSLWLEFLAQDSSNALKKMNVFINEVPLFGSSGRSIEDANCHEFSFKHQIPLGVGLNKIQVSVQNDLGLENFKFPHYVNFVPDAEVPTKTIFIGIGVNNFKNANHDLRYCIKDIKNLSEAFSESCKNLDTLIFTDEEVTRESILSLKTYLQTKTAVNDRVIISCSSHGLLDDSLNFYLATYDVDFGNPKDRGLSFADLESLLDDIPARQKLLLLDACNSGENERMYMSGHNDAAIAMNDPEKRGVIMEIVSSEIQSFQTMSELFVNVRNNTGSVIISAAGGMQSALEAIQVDGKVIENGAFTYCILEYLRQTRKDGTLTVNGMKNYVERRVEEITDGKQKPTSRQETMEVDWELFNCKK